MTTYAAAAHRPSGSLRQTRARFSSAVSSLLLSISLALLSGAANSSDEVFLDARPNCAAQVTKGATDISWSGDCAGGKAVGFGALTYKSCGANCTYVLSVGVLNAGRFVGMSIDYFGDTPARNDEIAVGFYDNSGDEVSEYVNAQSRRPINIPDSGTGRPTLYLAYPFAIAKGAKNPGIGHGLTLDEVFHLWEAWSSNPGSGPPRELPSISPGPARTADYLRARDSALAERDRQFAEWKQRRDERRAERARIDSAQPSGQQQLANALERYAAYKALGIVIVEQTGDQAFYKSLDHCFYTVPSRIANSVHVGNKCEHDIEWWNSGGSGSTGYGVLGPKQLMSNHFVQSFNLPPSRVCLRNDVASSSKPGLCRIDPCKLNAASCGSGTGTGR